MEKSENPPPYSPYPSPPPHVGFVAPQPMYPALPPNPAPVTVVVTPPSAYGAHSLSTSCPHCKHQIITRTETEASTKTHLIALLLCMFCCWACCCIPYCVDSCQNVNHYCPNCKAYLGSYKN